MPLLVVGSVAFDTVKTPYGLVYDVLGGSGTYCAYGACLLTPAWLVSPVGDDMPLEHLEEMRRHNIDTAGVRVVRGGRTFRWTGSYSGDFRQRTTERVEMNVFEHCKTAIPDEYRDAEYVFLANGAPEEQMAALEQLPRRKLAFINTMPHWITGSRRALLDLMKMIDGIVLNDEEMRFLTGEARRTQRDAGVCGDRDFG